MNVHMLTLNFNKKGPSVEVDLLKQIFFEQLQSAAYQTVFFKSEPIINDYPFWRFTCSNLDKAL